MKTRRVGWILLGCLVWIAASCSSDDLPPVSSSGCTKDSDCAGTLICSWGRCHEVCSTSKDCPRCGTELGRCAKSENGNVCLLCGPAGDGGTGENQCIYPSDCPRPLTCATDSKCRNQCVTRVDCVAGQLCVDGVCADPGELCTDELLVCPADAGSEASADGATSGDQPMDSSKSDALDAPGQGEN